MISVAHGNLNTPFIPVQRGVLQGDPSSPLLFNVCFNPLMQAIIQPKHDQLGYMWGPNADLRSRSWLQFADDTAIISHDVNKAQALLNLNKAWCAWADMKVRIDKCSTFGMRKQDGTYRQFQPFLTIGDQSLPAVDDSDSFKYLGKLFDFSMKNTAIKTTLRDQLKRLLEITSNLDIKPQQKLKILRNYIPTQFKFQLRIYDISYTWIELNLDTQVSNAVRDWIELPISSCVSEILSLPTNQGGLGIPSMKKLPNHFEWIRGTSSIYRTIRNQLQYGKRRLPRTQPSTASFLKTTTVKQPWDVWRTPRSKEVPITSVHLQSKVG